MQFKTNDEIEKIGNSKVTGIIEYKANGIYKINYPNPHGETKPRWKVEAPTPYVDQNFQLINKG